MTRDSVILALAIALLTPLPGGAQARPAVGNGPCPEGHPEMGDIGINYLLCIGGSCTVNLRVGRQYVHDFSTEPRIEGIDPDGPAAGKLRNGDVITAIDGVLITTREGGRRLANLRPGVPVKLSIRRAGVKMEVTLVPEAGCNMPQLAVMKGPVVPLDSTPMDRAEIRKVGRLLGPQIDFGLELECGDCGWELTPRGPLTWRSATAPKILAVEKNGPGDLAGLEPGDVLLKIDGHPFTTAEGGRFIAGLQAGRSATLEYRRGDKTRSTAITPRQAAPPKQKF